MLLWTGCRRPPVAMPSTVTTSRPATMGRSVMQLLIDRYVVRPAASLSTSATLHAPQSPSSQPHLLPVRPVARNQRNSVVVAGTPATFTWAPFNLNSKLLVEGLVSSGEERPVMSYRCQQIPRPANERSGGLKLRREISLRVKQVRRGIFGRSV